MTAPLLLVPCELITPTDPDRRIQLGICAREGCPRRCAEDGNECPQHRDEARERKARSKRERYWAGKRQARLPL